MRDDVKYVHEQIKVAGGLRKIDESIRLIREHLATEHLKGNGEVFTSKNLRLAQWDPTDEDLYHLVVAIFTTALTNNFLTFQAVVGKHNGAMPHENVIDRVKTTAEVVACLCNADLIDITRTPGDYYRITPTLVLKDIPFTDRHATVYDRPQKVESNWDPEQGPMILGGKLNYHDGNICLDHLNKMNSIPMRLNREFLLKYPEEREIKEVSNKGNRKSFVETLEEQELWRQYTNESKKRYAHALVASERLYLNHKPDTRGRTYAVGYYISTQGSSYKKACIELADAEKLNPMISMCTYVMENGTEKLCTDCQTQLMRTPEGQVFCPKCTSKAS